MLPKTKPGAISESDVVMYLAVGFKHIRLMALLVCLSLTLGMCYFIISRSVYYANGLVHYKTIKQQPIDSETIWQDDKSVIWMIQSPQIIARTAKKLGLDPDYRILYSRYIRKIRVAFNWDHDITIECWAYDPKITRQFAPTLLQEYLAHREEKRLEYVETAITTLTREISQMKDRMDHAVDQKFDFQKRNELDKLMIQLDELSHIPEDLAVVRHRIQMMDQIRDNLADTNRDSVAKLALISSLEQDKTTFFERTASSSLRMKVGDVVKTPSAKSTEASVVVLPSVAQPTLVHSWDALDKERHQIEMELTEKARHGLLGGHPQVVALKKQFDKITKALDLEFHVAYDNFNVEYASLLEKRDQLEKRLPEYQEVAHRHEKLNKEFGRYDAGQVAWGSMIAAQSQKLETIDYGFDKEHSELIFNGFIDYKDIPVAPNRFRILEYGLILGFILAIAVPFAFEFLNSRVSDMEHAEEELRIRGLGVVPKVTDAPFDHLLLHAEDLKSDHHIRESFRLIRTNLVVNAESGALPQVILVTSSMPQEGKTCVAANLALSFAHKGEKTLLIDGDLRRGRVHKLFEIEGKPGLSNILKGQATAEQLCQVVGHENLSVLVCGKHLNSASELLDSHTFTQLMTELRGKYQRIILDSPPVLGLSETLIMQRHADGVMMVIWSDFTPLSSVKLAMQSLAVNGAKFAGFVLNRLDFSAFTNRYKYFYYAPLYYANYSPQPLPAPAANIRAD